MGELKATVEVQEGLNRSRITTGVTHAEYTRLSAFCLIDLVRYVVNLCVFRLLVHLLVNRQ